MCRLHLAGPQRPGCFAPVVVAVVAVFVVVVDVVGDALCWAVAAAVSAGAVVVIVSLLKATVMHKENQERNNKTVQSTLPDIILT